MVNGVTTKIYKDAGLRVHREGDFVFAENLRNKYKAEIGKSYLPRSDLKTNERVGSFPRKLMEVSFIGGKWRAALQTEEGRDRIMDLNIFLIHYTVESERKKKDKKPKKELPPQERKAAWDWLVRIERKLDLLLSQLGVKDEGGDA